MWKRISTRLLLEHPRVRVEEDEVKLPDGSPTTYLRYEEPNIPVTVIARDDSGRILISREYSYPQGRSLYQFPGGAAEPGEDFAGAANRELMEETGFRASHMELLGSYFINNRRSNSSMRVYLATGLSPCQSSPDPEESIENFWHTPEEIDAIASQSPDLTFSMLAAWAIYSARNA